MSAGKVELLGRANRARTISEISVQIDQLRYKMDEVIASLSDETDQRVDLGDEGVLEDHASTHLPSGIDPLTTGTPTSILPDDVAAESSSESFARGGHKHGITATAHGESWGTAAAEGSGNNFMRADGTFAYPEALGTAADRTKVLTLTNDGTLGAMLQQSAGFAADNIHLRANGGSAGLSVGSNGNVALNSIAVPIGGTVLNFIKLSDFGNSPTIRGMNATVWVNSGTGGGSFQGSYDAATLTSLNTGDLTGLRQAIQPFGGTFTQNAYGIVSQITTGPNHGTVPLWHMFDSQTGSSSNGAVTDFVHYGVRTPTTGPGASITNAYGFRCRSLPSKATNRWGVEVDNKIECRASDFIASTVGKGCIVKSGSGDYMRMSVSANNGIVFSNIGATPPAT